MSSEELLEENTELQASECEALTSTFPLDDFFTLSRSPDSGLQEGAFTAFMRLPHEGILVLGPLQEDGSREELHVDFLPPLMLTFVLPQDYPSSCAPEFQLQTSWVGSAAHARLVKELDRICEENRGGFAVFAMCMFLQDEAVSCLELHQNRLNLAVLSSRPGVQAGLLRLIRDSANEQKALEYSRSSHTCPLCMEDKTGAHFFLMQQCGHAFCRECVKTGYEVYIRDGELDAVKCLQCDLMPAQFQLQEILSPELYDRYEKLMLSRGLETMSDVMTCPRQDCATPVLLDIEGGLGHCSACQFAFCIHCQRAYHGVNPCSIKDAEKLVQEFLNANAGKKKDFEKRYGQRNLEIMVENFESNKILQQSTRCPSCKSPCEKIDGCNKMTCSKCGCFFCWLCGTPLNRMNPYSHFNLLNGTCVGRLFEGVTDLEDGNDWEFDLFDA